MRLSPIFLVASATAFPITSVLPSLSIPVNLVFGVQVQTSSSPSTSPITLLLSGYRIPVPIPAQSGLLISWLANYADSVPYNTQLNLLNPSAPRNITTDSTSVSQDGGPSISNATASADGRQARVISTTYSSGNAASAAAAALDGTTSTSTSSSGDSNSTAVATSNALGQVLIATTSANTAAVLNTQSLQNARGAEAATSCAADSAPSASSSASQLNSLYIPIGKLPNGDEQWIKSEAVAACKAGVEAPMVDEGGSSSSGSQASLTGVSSMARCDGVSSTEMKGSTTFRVGVVGVYTLGKGFGGAVGGERVARSRSEC
ncbi:het domain-containing [Pyrenophora seminiperda CCB06]|uniref:Het domain-containing n=1 Tax=Pyrenophora seminiperda CCB06 TaxID=1302712 RepID=A0A3M7LX25_9PLEO|nr:het domain-containing [Pyrenophora seminiperda CCB06]